MKWVFNGFLPKERDLKASTLCIHLNNELWEPSQNQMWVAAEEEEASADPFSQLSLN